MATLAMQIHVRQWRGLLWVGTLALAAWAGLICWKIFDRQRSGGYEPRDANVFTQEISNALGTIDQKAVKLAQWDDYKRLVSSPLNGHVKEIVKPVDPTPVGPTKLPEKPLTDVLKISAITSAPSEAGRVVVKYKDDSVKPTRDELILGIGSTLTSPYDDDPYHGRLKAIHAGVAVFDWCGKEVELRPQRVEEGRKHSGPSAGGATAAVVDTALSDSEKEFLKQKVERTITLPNDAGYLIGSKDHADLSSNARSYLNDLKLKEVANADGKKELTVGNMRANSSMAKTYGVQAGDTLISINGTPASTEKDAYSYIRENGSLSKYVVVLRRKGKEITKTILVNRE
jgi:hypothetical protein